MKFSLRKKTVLMITAIALVLSAVSILCTRKGITDIIIQQYTLKSEDLGNTIANTIDLEKTRRLRDATLALYEGLDEKDLVSNEAWDTPEWEAYAARYQSVMEMPEYGEIQEWLRRFQDVNHVECVYLIHSDLKRERVIYVVDAAYEDTCTPGMFDSFTEIDKKAMETPEKGFTVDITNTAEYGWLLSVGLPVFDEGHSILCYVGVDLYMNDVMAVRDQNLLIMTGLMVLLAVIISCIGILLVDRFIVRPVNVLSQASEEYCCEDVNETHHTFADLNINTGDELEALASSMVRMEQDINNHISNLVATTRELLNSREHEMELDRQANIDALTRVRNKRAYNRETVRLDEEIEQGQARFGIAVIDMNELKSLNDRYGHEKGDAAIKALCAIICAVFRHSPVFRFGGDEFTVILERYDLENIDVLLNNFDAEVRRRKDDPALPPWEKISAAIGCAFYQPDTDKNTEAVFKRADAAMYDKKRQMKGGR